jgi:heptosyltransferase III
LSPRSHSALRRILVIRTDRIGDVVLSTPVLTALRQRYCDAFIAMLVRPYTLGLVSGHPHADEILLDDASGINAGVKGFFRLVKLLRSRDFDTVLILHPTFRLALLCFLSGIPHRVGTGYRAYSFLINQRVFQHRKHAGRHELDLNLDLARAVGAPLDVVQFHLAVPEEAFARVRMLLQTIDLKPGQPFVILHPGSGGSAIDWPVSSFAELADRIHDELGVSVLVTGNNAETGLIDRLCALTKAQPRRLDGKLTIKELLALLSLAQVLVANSTGPLHMAVAVGCRIVGLFCPLVACSPVRWGPYGQLDSVLMPPLPPCEKCEAAYCQTSSCMELITVEKVFSKVKEQFFKRTENPAD